MLTITDFQKKYPGSEHTVLSIPALHLNKGIYWIRGENGAGKTSLIKSIAGLIPFKGQILVNGISIKTNRIGYTKIVNYAEAEPLYPLFLTGRELLSFYKSTKGGGEPLRLMEAFGIHKFLHQKTGVYSSGMMKKLSLALAFTGNPQLVLLDEPLIALDADAVTVLQEYIRFSAHQGISFIITSHQPLNNDVVAIDTTFNISNQTITAV